MPLDIKRGYGLITGHPWARYEQDGVLYDAQGNDPQDEPESPEENQQEAPEPGARDFALENAKDFLKTVLNGGPVTKSAVYRACEMNNQNWEKVQEAFAQLKGEVVRNGNWTLWKLRAD